MKRKAYLIAKQLGYEKLMPNIKSRIYSCTTQEEITRVLITARHMERR